MVDLISNAPNLRDVGAVQSRPQSLPVHPSPGAVNPQTNLPPDHRVAELEKTVDNLIKKSLPDNSKLQISQDKDTGTFVYRSIDPSTGEVIRQWPPEQLLKLRESLRQMDGMIVDQHV